MTALYADVLVLFDRPRAKLLESEAVNEGLRKNLSRASTRSSLYGGPALLAPEREANDVIELAKIYLDILQTNERMKKNR